MYVRILMRLVRFLIRHVRILMRFEWFVIRWVRILMRFVRFLMRYDMIFDQMSLKKYIKVCLFVILITWK